MSLTNTAYITFFAALNKVGHAKWRDQKDLEKIATDASSSLKDFVKEVLSDDPMGLWQEIKSLPENSKALFNKHIVTAFSESAEEIDKAIKTKNVTTITKSLFNASSKIFGGFKNFFAELSEKHAKLSKIATQAIKIAFIIGVFALAPYLGPVATQVLMNLDLIVGEAKFVHEKISTELSSVGKAFGEVTDIKDLSDISEIIQKLNDLIEQFKVPLETLLSLNFDIHQLKELEKVSTEPHKLAKPLNEMKEVKEQIPFTIKAIEYFVGKETQGLFTKIIEFLADAPKSTKDSVKQIFDKNIQTALDKIREVVVPQINIFEQVANFSKAAEVLDKTLKGVGVEISKSNNASNAKIVETLNSFVEQRLTKPIARFQEAISSIKGISEALGLTKAASHDIKTASSKETALAK
jgi:hypothetical protein